MSSDLPPGLDGAPTEHGVGEPLAVVPVERPVADEARHWEGPLGLHRRPGTPFDQATWSSEADLVLRRELEEVLALGPVDELVAPDLPLAVPDPEAVALVRRFFADVGGRGIVVESPGPAGPWVAPLVLAELVARGRAEQVLVAGAPGTAERLAADLRGRAGVVLDVVLTAGAPALAGPRLVLDHDLVEAEADRLATRPWDLVVVDAAHLVAGDDAGHVRRAVGRLLATTTNVLLLTPAPARSALVELRRLVELARPGTLRPDAEFRARLVDPDLPLAPSRPEELRRLVAPVLVRATTTAPRAPRPQEVELHEVEPGADEQAVIGAGVALVAEHLEGVEGWPARRLLVPHLSSAGPGSAAVARRAAALAPPSARAALLALAHDAQQVDERARDRLLATLVRLWAGAHGRVLVATRSAEDAGHLSRRLEQEGLDAALVRSPDHDGATADVVVVHDGALLGARLGSFGALVQADVAWDPVVVADRLAAAGPGDAAAEPLAVATFVTARSVDATVARILADELQVHRLPPGGVRGLLSEIDPATAPVGPGDPPLCFADRLVVALTEQPDDVEDALEDLAHDLEAARRRTKLLGEAAAGFDAWWAPEGPLEAPPAASGEARADRRREVLARWSRARGARVVRHEPGLLVTRDLLDADERRWTFDRAGRRAHPDADLFAPGTPAHAEVVAALREEVVVAVDVAEPVDLPVVQPHDHVPEVTLVDRLLEPPSTWSATTTWRVGHGVAEQTLEDVASGSAPERGAPRRTLDAGEPLPVGLPPPAEILDRVLRDAAEALGPVAAARAEAAGQAADAERSRLLVRHHAEVDAARATIDDTSPGSPEHERAAERLRALHGEHPADQPPAAPDPDARVRADLVSVRLVGGDDVVVVERWRHESGAEAEVRHPWSADGTAVRCSEVSGSPVDVLALCVDGHVVDADELVRCPRCATAGCDACGVARVLAPCPTCGVQVCGACRRDGEVFGPCAGCRAPVRDEAGDTEHARAWRLGGTATLLVGRRWAALRRTPDEEPVLLVPDVDVGDAARRRLRRAAAARGLPLDTGTAACPRGTRPLPGPDDVWLRVVPGEHWTVVAGRGEQLDEPLDGFEDADPGDQAEPGADPVVEGEGRHEAAALLARLRHEEPPPAPPAFVRTPHVDVTRTTVVADGLVEHVVRVSADGEEDLLAEQHVALVATPSSEEQSLFRPVAGASVGEVTLVLERLHRATVVRLTTPTGTREWHVPGVEGTTFGAELAWASWAEEEGLEPGAVLEVCTERPELVPDALADPDGASLDRRVVVDVWGADPVEADGPGRGDALPASDEDLALVGYEEVPDLEMPAVPPGHLGLARSLHELGERLDEVGPRPHLLHHRWFELEEHWHGRVPVRLAYKVGPDDPAWPRLDDTHERAPDFEVDDHGHLHEPGAGWRCLACGEHHCRACGPVGAMDVCESCGQDACGLCRARTPRRVADERCDVCGDRSCGDCGRVPGAAPCAVCRRSTCRRCQVAVPDQAPRCRACDALRPATEEEVAGLPAVLAAHGLQVQLGAAAGEVSVLLLGAWRTEVAVLRGMEVRWWVHHDDEDPLVRSLLLAAARRWEPSGDVQPVATGWTRAPEVGGPSLLLLAEDVPDVRWSFEVGGQAVAGSPTPPRPADDDVDPALDALDRLEPVVVDVLRREVEAGDPGARWVACDPALHLLQPAPPLEGARPDGADPLAGLRTGRDLAAGARLLVEDRRHATATWLTPDGLERIVADGDVDRRTHAPWQVGVRFAWMVEGWEPTPDVVAYALLGGLEAALVRVGRHLVLGVRGDEQVVWWTLRDEPGDLQRTLLGEHLTGEERLLDLRVVTDPGKVEGPTVLDATFVDRRIEPVLEEVGQEDGDPDEALRAAAAWVRRQAKAPRPSGPPLPADLCDALVQRADELRPPVLESVGIALQVVETWRQGIDDVLVPYRLAPGTTRGLVTCVDSGRGAQVVHRDRSGHLVEAVERCPWCELGGCAACHVRVRACPVCSVGVCDTCALEDGRCPTCAAFVLVDRKQAKREGRRVGRRAVVLQARSDVREVLAVRDGGWSVEVRALGTPVSVLPDERRPEVLDGVVAALLARPVAAAAPVQQEDEATTSP